MKKLLVVLAMAVSLVGLKGEAVYNKAVEIVETKTEAVAEEKLDDLVTSMEADPRIEKVVRGRNIEGKLFVKVKYLGGVTYKISGDTYQEVVDIIEAWLD